jgi:DtxR family transcriptional regulator, Mn-dependent transcriptional regulator
MDSHSLLSSSMEDYLETIYWLIQESKVARVKDIAEKLSVSMPSVSGALKTLAAKGLVNYDPYQYITLTEEGEVVARQLAKSHEVIRDFLIRVLQVPQPQAEANACRMEHAVDEETLERFIQFLEYIDTCPQFSAEWEKGVGYFCHTHPEDRNCSRCVREIMMELDKNQRSAKAGLL